MAWATTGPWVGGLRMWCGAGTASPGRPSLLENVFPWPSPQMATVRQHGLLMPTPRDMLLLPGVKWEGLGW